MAVERHESFLSGRFYSSRHFFLIIFLIITCSIFNSLRAECVKNFSATERFELHERLPEEIPNIIRLPLSAVKLLVEQCPKYSSSWFGFTRIYGDNSDNNNGEITFNGMSIFTDFAQNVATFQGVDIDPLPTLVDNCPDIVYEKEIFGLRGDIGLYTVHFGRGPEPKRILEGEFTFCDQIRVTSNLSVINVIEVPIHISGVVGAALNIGDLTNDLAQAELYLSGKIADQSIGPFRVKVDSTDPGFAGVILPEERSISESRTIQLEVPPEGREFEIQITGGFKATSSAKADGLFGLLTAASTAYIFFPSSIYVGNFRGLNGGPVPDGITIRSLKTGVIYNPKPGNSNTPVSVPNVGGLTESAAVSLLASRGLASNCTNFVTTYPLLPLQQKEARITGATGQRSLGPACERWR